jgi:RNA polymerase sigma-70 factor (ECF subfamily)
MGPLRDCPKCGKTEFGVFNVAADRYERLCRNCRASQTLSLPAIQKTVVYLDQFAVSNLSYVRTKEKTLDDFWHEAYKKLTHLSILQRIVCPKSVAHVIESETSPRARVDLDETALLTRAPDRSLLALDEALTTFAQVAPRQAKVEELRHFGGLTEKEIVVALNISPRTVRRDWDLARAWLLRELNQ